MRDCRRETRHQCRTGDLIGQRCRVEVEENTRIVGLVKLSTLDAIWSQVSVTSDFEVEALRVVLRSVRLARAVKSNNLVAKDIVARSQCFWNLKSPREAGSNEDIGCPLAAVHRHINKTFLTNLEELKIILVNSLTVSRTSRKIINHRPFVRLRPSVPLQSDLVTCCNSYMTLARPSCPVADDIGVSEGIGLNIAVISGTIGPTDDRRMIGVPAHLRGRVTAKSNAVCYEPVHMAVSGDSRG